MTDVLLKNHWAGKKVAFLGDSITDAIHVGTTKNYWQFLQDILGIEPLVYGINGSTFPGVFKQAQQLYEERGSDVDCIMVFAGTNDYSGGVQLGEWFTYQPEAVNYRGRMMTLRKRSFDFTESTFRGRINIVLQYLKEHFPDQQIIMLTMLHRAFAEFGGDNIQPAECFGNSIGHYLEEYVQAVKEAANIWAVPVIDLNALSGLFPMLDCHSKYFHDAVTDRLHPAAPGHERMAKALAMQMLTLPATFR